MAVEQTSGALAPERQEQTETGIGVQQGDQQYFQTQYRTEKGKAPEKRIANFLGWFSIGLGLAEVLAPKGFARLIGTKGKHTAFIRYACGLREITAGIGILTNRRPTRWMWARVAGDALDLAATGVSLASPDSNKTRVALAMTAVAGVTALDIADAKTLGSLPTHTAV